MSKRKKEKFVKVRMTHPRTVMTTMMITTKACNYNNYTTILCTPLLEAGAVYRCIAE